MGIEIFPMTIMEGENISSSVDLGDKMFCGIQMPQVWTDANIIMEGTHNGTDFYRFDRIVAHFSEFLRFDPMLYAAVKRMRFKSVLFDDSPVNQAADRTILIIGRSFGCSVNIAC